MPVFDSKLIYITPLRFKTRASFKSTCFPGVFKPNLFSRLQGRPLNRTFIPLNKNVITQPNTTITYVQWPFYSPYNYPLQITMANLFRPEERLTPNEQRKGIRKIGGRSKTVVMYTPPAQRWYTDVINGAGCNAFSASAPTRCGNPVFPSSECLAGKRRRRMALRG